MQRSVAVAFVWVFLLLACRGGGKSGGLSSLAVGPDPENATYVVEGKTTTLANGRASEPAAPGSSAATVTALTVFTAAGDIDGDGRPDRAVVLTRIPGGSGIFYYLAALTTATSVPPPAVFLGDRISITQISIKAGAISVSYLTRPEGAPFTATPSVPTSKIFTLVNGRLIEP